MTILLVRHTHAGDRSAWEGDDRERPISELGRAQARELVTALDGHRVERILSSPLRRCVQSVEPLAAACGLPVEEEPRLAEATPRSDVRALLAEVARQQVVLCSHGDVIGDLVGELRLRGVHLPDPPRWAKGSTWVLDLDDDGSVTAADYIPAPRVQVQ